jgi:transposase-like protein
MGKKSSSLVTISMVRCPACRSSRIRNGYYRAPLHLQLLCIREFHCESCNTPFRAFALRPAKSRSHRRSHRKADVFNKGLEVDLSSLKQPLPAASEAGQQPAISFDQAGIATLTEQAPEEAADESSSAAEEQAATAPRRRRHRRSSPACPHCGSAETRRRRRRAWERMISFFTGARAYSCRSCGASFHARKESR